MKQADLDHEAVIKPPQVIETPEALHDLASRLIQEPRLAVDTEANSLYAYREQVCLIQFSIPGINYLVDPLELDDLSPLAPIFTSPDIEKVFHAADYDLSVLRRDFGFVCTNLFDTMWAARILGWPRVGLANILEKLFGVHLNKRYQRYNWGKRPLDPEALTYAWTDSYHLLALREIQKEELQAKDRWEEAQEIFAYLCENVHIPQEPNPDEFFWRIKGIHDLRQYEQRVLYQLHCWRETEARKLDRPTVKVISNNRLIQLAQIRPRNRQELLDADLTPFQVRRFGSGILQALQADPMPLPPPQTDNERSPADVVDRYNALKAWRKDVAARRGVDSDVILPNAVLWKIATNPPHTPDALARVSGIGPWRQAAYGPAILEIIREQS